VTPGAAELVERLRARGVELVPAGDRLRFRPADALSPEELDALRAHKSEVMALLTPPWQPPALDPLTVEEVLGPDPDPRALELVQHEVAAAVGQLRFAMRAGPLPGVVQTVYSRPLADWLPADSLAGLLREEVRWNALAALRRARDHLRLRVTRRTDSTYQSNQGDMPVASRPPWRDWTVRTSRMRVVQFRPYGGS
jgi:tubulysin polyketide synthase-like protein